jgi:hypothetical protein
MKGEYLNKSECYKVAEEQGVKAQRKVFLYSTVTRQ